MEESIIHALLALWAGWVLIHLLLMVAVSTFLQPDRICFTGFTIVVPEWAKTMLTPRELEAAILHEQGHRYHGHVWKAFALNALFMKPSANRQFLNELEADDYAARKGYASELHSALFKLADASDMLAHPVITRRLQRLRINFAI